MKTLKCLVILLLAACAQDVKMATPPDADRRWMKVAFDTVWIVGGNARDSILSYPARLTSLGGLIVVSDLGRHQLIALRVRDGTVAWTNGPEDGHSFLRPLVVWPKPGNHIAVVDEDTQIMTIIDSTGRTVSDLALNPSRLINGACALQSRDNLVTSVDGLGPLYTLADDAVTAAPVTMSVLDGKGHDPLVLQPYLESNRDWATCVVATSFGGGLALWNGSAFTRETRYREYRPFPVPRKREQTRTTDSGDVKETFPVLPPGVVVSALDVATVPGRVRVLFNGTSANRGRIIDDYDDRTLEYLGSALLPSRAIQFATPRPDLVVVLSKQRGFPTIVALRQRATAP